MKMLYSIPLIIGLWFNVSVPTWSQEPAATGQQDTLVLKEITNRDELNGVIEQATRRSVFLAVLVYSRSCDNCKVLAQNLVKESALYEHGEFIPLKINGDTEFGKQIMALHGIDTIPVMIIASGQGHYVAHESFFPENDLYYFLEPYVERYLDFYRQRQEFAERRFREASLVEYISSAAELGQINEATLAADALDSILRSDPDRIGNTAYREVLPYLPGTSTGVLYAAYRDNQLNDLSDRERHVIADNIYQDILAEAASKKDTSLVTSMIHDILDHDDRYDKDRAWMTDNYLSKVSGFWKTYYLETGNVANYSTIMKEEIESGRSTPFIEARDILDRSPDINFIQLAILELKEDLKNQPASAHYAYIAYGYLKLRRPEEAKTYYQKAVETATDHSYPQSLIRLLAPYFK